MEHSRCCRRDEPKHACTNESGVDAYDGAVVGVDPLHETVTELLECHQFIQVICANGDVGNFTSQLCAITDSNANIRCRKSRRIVDPVPDHNGFGSVFPFSLNEAGLVFRKHFGIIFVHTNTLSDDCCSSFAVARHHYHLGDTCFFQLSDGVCCFFTQRIFDADHSYQLAVDSHIKVRVSFRQVFKLCLSGIIYDAIFIFKDEVITSDHDLSVIDFRRNTVSDDIIHLRVHFSMFKTLLSRSIHNGFCHGVREVFFQTCCDPQHFIVGFITEVDDGSYDRHGFRQRSCLIEYDGRCFSDSFHVLAAFDHDVVFPGFSDRRKHSHRHSQFQCTGEIDHQNGQRLGSISGKKPYQCSSQQCIRNQSVRQMFRLALGR